MAEKSISLSVPAEAEFARVVRMTAANLAVLCDMNVDEVDDLRMAAEEGFVYSCATAPAGGASRFGLAGRGVHGLLARRPRRLEAEGAENLSLVQLLLGRSATAATSRRSTPSGFRQEDWWRRCPLATRRTPCARVASSSQRMPKEQARVGQGPHGELFRRYKGGRGRGRPQLAIREPPEPRQVLVQVQERGKPWTTSCRSARSASSKAIDHFDLPRPRKFTTFATPTILGEIEAHFRDKGWWSYCRELQELVQGEPGY